MIDNSKNKSPVVITEIMQAQKRRAKRFMADPLFGKRVDAIRQKYIVDGFLMPLYGRDGRYARSRRRVSQFGNYILPGEIQGTVFFEGQQGWIRNEYTWFWFYLIDGQDVVRSELDLPEKYKINGIPANLVWLDIVALVKELHLYGEAGGGMLIPGSDVDSDNLSGYVKLAGSQEGEDGYMESYGSSNTPGWMMLFDVYDSYRRSRKDFEVRPAWFHLVKYVLFNAPIRLPVFAALFTADRKLKELKFLEDGLSDRARNFIGAELLSMPIRLRKMIEGIHRREREEMTWWLWHNVGQAERKGRLSYGEIAKIAGAPKSSIQSAAERFALKLNQQLDGKLLGRLLRIAASLRLGHNLTYDVLVTRGLVPARERGIDGFDDLDRIV